MFVLRLDLSLLDDLPCSLTQLIKIQTTSKILLNGHIISTLNLLIHIIATATTTVVGIGSAVIHSSYCTLVLLLLLMIDILQLIMIRLLLLLQLQLLLRQCLGMLDIAKKFEVLLVFHVLHS
jgi:hypothetical protein